MQPDQKGMGQTRKKLYTMWRDMIGQWNRVHKYVHCGDNCKRDIEKS
jgi:hypothetical protein